jgi:outer membrane protein OmpA-like peptidoglycan-associated protein
MKHIIRSTTGALVAGMIAAGCSTSPPASDVAAANTAIGNAGQAVDQAAADPHVAKYATSELERATASLDQARTAWNKQHDLKATRHLAYVAQQRAATAQQLANERAAEEVVTVAAAERDHAVNVAAANRRAKPVTEQAREGLAGFSTGTAKLPAKAAPKINELAAMLRSNPERMVVIEGHTDNVGSQTVNQALAMKRAEAVRAALLRRGVNTSRIVIRSYGEENPVASNDTPVGRRENRRAQVIIGDMEERMVGSSTGSTATTSSGSGGQSGQSGQK